MSSEFGEYDRTESAAEGEILEVLSDECSRTILAVASDRAVSAKDLTERCDVSSATVYRRINTLLERDLLREGVSFTAEPKQNTVYETTFEHLDVDLSEDGFVVQKWESHSEAVELARLLASMSIDRIQMDPSDGEIRIDLYGDLLEQFMDAWNQT